MRKTLITCTALLAACATETVDRTSLEPALGSFNADSMMDHIRTLSSDAFEGRAPGTAGEDSTVAYLEAQFKALGLAPGNPDGTYIQNVELIGYTATSTASVRI